MRETADDGWWSLLDELAVTHQHLRPLIEQFDADFSVDAGGFRQFAALTDELQRAVVSDQLLMTATAIKNNLAESRLHQRQLEEIVGNDGLSFPEEASYPKFLRRSAEMDMAITGCVRAMGSALDCMAGVAIGVTRMPISQTRASYSNITGLAGEPKRLADATPKQREAWQGMISICQHHEHQPPAGWLDWLIKMRNLNVHRARQTHTLLQRVRENDQPQVILFTDDPAALHKRMARFDLHLRRRPDLPDMHDFVTAEKTTDLWINEAASTTLSGVLMALNALIEEAAQWLASWWRYAAKWPSCFPPPTSKWRVGPTTAGFLGVAPSTRPFPVGTSHVGEVQAKRMALAQKLRP